VIENQYLDQMGEPQKDDEGMKIYIHGNKKVTIAQNPSIGGLPQSEY